jgi:signal transduction histidine kinase/DNA-binding response OmpR family regulator
MSSADIVNILIVDDLAEKVLVLKSVLEEPGQNVMTAYSGTDALRQALEHDFAVILLDVNMPDIDGFETAALIRRRRKSAHTPIIFITGFADEMHTAQGYSLGAVDYILSPVVPEILRTKVKVFVELFRLNLQIKKQAEERIALAHEQAARAAAEEATRRSAFLAEASKVLTSSLDADAILGGLARLAVPFLADVAGVTLLLEHGEHWATEMAWTFPPDPTLHTGRLKAPEGPQDELRDALERALRSGSPQMREDLNTPYPPAPFAAPAGEHRVRTAAILPLRARGRTLGALTLALCDDRQRFDPDDLALADDLAARAAIALDNARLYQSIQESDRHKNQFLAMLAHELRNPLAPIRNAVEVMRFVGTKEPSLVQVQDMIDRQVTHMARLIDDLLDMSRISRGKILLRKEQLDLVELVRGVVEDYRSGVETAGLKLDLQLPAGPLWTIGDPTRLAQVVGNVLHNAQKFTDAGGRIRVEARRLPDEATAEIVVYDSGIGMEPGMLARVFETFTQADRSLDRSRGGLGLGLALVKGLVELHGGEVRAGSDGLGRGTRMAIRLPLPEHVPQQPKTERGPAAATASSHRVLVIEDNQDAAASMEMLLRLAGHQVQVAYSGPTGVEAARGFAPHVVLCDIGLPGGMDGYAVARTLRKDPALQSAYLIALTGYGQDGDKSNSRDAGFDVHLTKPVDFHELQGLLASVTQT